LREEMAYKYSIYQSTCSSVILNKRDEKDNRSIFVLSVVPKKYDKKKEILCIVDNELIGRDNWFGTTVKDVLDSYADFYEGGDNEFDWAAQKSIWHLLRGQLKPGELSSETGNEIKSSNNKRSKKSK